MRNFKYLYILLFAFCASCTTNEDTTDTQQQEQEQLDNMFNEIKSLSLSKTCDNASEWKFVAYGSKPCGGEAGYIAYSSAINTTDFLSKIKDFTNAQSAYNKKWGLISDCSIEKKPIEIVCENGIAILKYQ